MSESGINDATDETEASKRAALAYYEAMNSRDVDRILSTYTDDARTWVLGDGPYAGEHPVARETLALFLEAMDIRFTVLSMIAEGDTVAVELESEGSAGGRPYSNRYHNRLTIRDGRVAYLKEYFDTARAGG